MGTSAEIPSYVWQAIAAATSFGTALGYMLNAIKHQKKAIHGFNGEKQAIQDTLTTLDVKFSDMSNRLIRIETEFDLMKSARARKAAAR